jgi:hypothetical protein
MTTDAHAGTTAHTTVVSLSIVRLHFLLLHTKCWCFAKRVLNAAKVSVVALVAWASGALTWAQGDAVVL